MSIPDADARESVRRLIDLLQILLPERAGVVYAIERAVLSLLVDDMRQRIMQRLQTFSPEEVQTVDDLTASLVKRRRGEAIPAGEEPDGAA
jgi:hypothetical protein